MNHTSWNFILHKKGRIQSLIQFIDSMYNLPGCYADQQSDHVLSNLFLELKSLKLLAEDHTVLQYHQLANYTHGEKEDMAD